jgi:hypothetical protein
LLFLFGLGLSKAQAAFELPMGGPRSVALGGAGVALAGDVWGSSRNPAICAATADGFGFFWAREFGLPELTREVLLSRLLVGGQPVALRASNLGGELYREGDLGCTLARSIIPGVAVGLETDLKWLEIKGYSTAKLATFTGGIWTVPWPGAAFGAVWRHFNEPRIPGYEGRLPSSLALGFAARVGTAGTVAADLLQEQHFRAEYRFGAEVKVHPILMLRIGASAEPVRPAAGFELSSGRWIFDYGGDLHPDLGPSHHVGLSFRFRP